MNLKKGDLVEVENKPQASVFRMYLNKVTIGTIDRVILKNKYYLVTFNTNDIIPGKTNEPYSQIIPYDCIRLVGDKNKQKGQLPDI